MDEPQLPNANSGASKGSAASSFETVAVVGVGLIGGSLCLALRRGGYEGRLLGVSRPEVREEGLRRGVFDEAFGYDDLVEVTRRADLVVLATPIGRILEQLQTIAESEGIEDAGETLITDVGSTKGALVRRAAECLPPNLCFIGGHPLAGSEERGLHAADPLLFENAFWVLTPAGEDQALRQKVDRLGSLLGLTGARMLTLDPDEHDRIAAAISHVPQLLAVELVNSLGDLDEGQQIAHRLAAGGFRDMTRIASSPFGMWQDIFATNPHFVAETLRRFARRVDALADRVLDITARDGIHDLASSFEQAHLAREHIPPDTKGFLTRLWDLRVTVEDRPGMIAEISGKLYDKGINIKDLEVLKVREGETGSVRLSFSTRQIAVDALEELERIGYSARLRE